MTKFHKKNTSKYRNKQSKVKQDGIYCLYANADQLLNKIEDLKMMIASKKPDVMLFTEVIPKAQKNPIEETQIQIKGYQHYPNFNYTDTNLGSAGIRGVIIYVREGFKSKSVRLKSSYDDHVWVEICLQNDEKLLCGCIYRSPDKERTLETTNNICMIINEVCKSQTCNLIICGDFNYPQIDWVNEFANEQESAAHFINTIQDSYLYQHVFKPTRYREGNEPSLLDLIFTSEKGDLQDLRHNPGLGESDHECIDFTLNCNSQISDTEEKPNYFKGDYPTIRQRLKQVEWETNLQGNFTTAYSKFITILENASRDCIPRYKNASYKKNMYLTPKAIRMKDLKHKLWRRYKKTRSDYDFNRYKTTKNQLRSLTRSLRNKFENNIVQDLKLAPKKFWSYVKSRTKTRSRIPTLRKKDGSDAVNDLDKAEALNDFFCSTFTNEDLNNIPDDPSEYNGEMLDSFSISPEVLQKKFHDLNPGKPGGLDGWPPIFLKNISDLITIPLSKLFQKSLDEGMVPSQWLEACITAIHKKEEKDLCENYRPVSITSIICKLMESIVRDQIVTHMEKNNLFSDKQHGFVPKRNCITNLLTCMELWTNMIEEGSPIDIIYTDFAKAFDKVPHQRLLKKMKNLGITGKTLSWISAFLNNRRQCVRVDNEYSSWKNVVSGIPQGSVLGPILFVIFINDMPDAVESLCLLFADDAKIFRTINTRLDINNLQDDINKLHAWSEKWQLPFNVVKCKCLHIGSKNTKHKYKINGHKLDHVDEEKDLGVLMDEKFDFHRQTAAAIKKANRVLGIVKRTFSIIDKKTLPLLFKSLVRQILEYGNIIWGPFYKGDKLAVERVQRRATKLITSIKDFSYEERLRILQMPSLSYRRDRGDMIQLHKIVNDQVNVEKDLFIKEIKSTTRGHSKKLRKGKATKLARINTFSNRIIDDWNSLPHHVVEAKTTNLFKSEIDDHWNNRMYKSPW